MTRRNFVAVPRDLVRDTNVSAGAKHLYLVLCDIAWQRGWRQGGHEIQLPPRDELAEAAGATLSTTKRHLTELRAAGWVVTRQGNRRAPSVYVIHDDRSGPHSTSAAHQRAAETPVGGPPVGRRTRPAPSSSLRDIGEPLRGSPSGGYDPVAGRRVGGRNLPFDALVESTGATGRLNAGRVAVALRSIREEAWQSVQANGYVLERVGDGTEYERGLAAQIELRARRLRDAHPEWEITPETVARYWTRMAGDRPTAGRASRIADVVAQTLAATAP